MCALAECTSSSKQTGSLWEILVGREEEEETAGQKMTSPDAFTSYKQTKMKNMCVQHKFVIKTCTIDDTYIRINIKALTCKIHRNVFLYKPHVNKDIIQKKQHQYYMLTDY